MKKKISANIIYIGNFAAFLILSSCFLTIIFLNSRSRLIRSTAVIFILLLLLIDITFILLIRKKVVAFAKILGSCIDSIVDGKKDVTFDLEPETLAAKLNHKLKRLYEIMLQNNERIQNEKQIIQEIVSDISHQVKTPVSNLKMYNSTLLERKLSREKEQEFLLLMDTQISKLDFLMQSMIKMSRLEAGIITLSVKSAPIYDTIAQSLGSIVLQADKKNIQVSVQCDPSLIVPHDKKWTAEALFNILDNAVKYTGQGGKISVTVERWEMYTKIDISDTGKGIPEEHYAQIFKRFYREEDVHDVLGVGIGLYLCREIISQQGGYIKVKSKVKNGSTFSVFLPNKKQLS